MLFSLGLGIDDDYYKIHGNNDASGNVIALLVDKVNHIFGKPFSWHAKCEVPIYNGFQDSKVFDNWIFYMDTV